MKRVNCWIFILVTLVLSACGSDVRNNEISGIASFHSSNSEREVYITPMEKDTIMIGAEPFKGILSKQQPWKKQKEKDGHLVMYVTDIKIYA